MNNIIQGNCLEIMKNFPDNKFKLTITSPPYNMRTRVRNGKYTTRENSEHFSKKYKYFSDALSIEEYYDFHKNCLIEMMRVSELVFWNIQIVTGSKEAVFKLIGDFHKEIRDVIVWDKGHGQPAMHSGILNRATELILIFEKDARAGREIKQSTFERGTLNDIWRIKRAKSTKGHGACFPLELPETIIRNFSVEGDCVLDPFAGTGTTALAAKNLNRDYILIEQQQEYINIINEKINSK